MTGKYKSKLSFSHLIKLSVYLHCGVLQIDALVINGGLKGIIREKAHVEV